MTLLNFSSQNTCLAEQEEADEQVQRAQADAQAIQTQIAERTEELVGRIEKRHKDIKATLVRLAVRARRQICTIYN